MTSIIWVVLICLNCVLLGNTQFAPCSNGDMGTSMGNFYWFLYRADVKEQGNTGMCWDFATVSYIETMYYILTKNKFRLSVQQVSDNIDEFFEQNPKYECKQAPRPAFNGGSSKC